MPQPPAFTGQRRDFITARKKGYAAAVKAGTQKDFVAQVQREFFNRWDVLLPLDVERPQSELDAVDDSVPSEEYAVPVAPEEGSENYEAALKKYEEAMDEYGKFKKTLELRKGQIERRLKSDYVRDNAPAGSRKPDLHDPFLAVTVQLQGGQLAKPHLTPAPLCWKRHNPEIVDSAYKKRKETVGPDQKNVPQLFQKVLKEEWEKLSPEVRKEWESKAKEIHQEAVGAWEKAVKEGPSTRPEDRQRAINALGHFMKPILDGICAATGLSCTLIAGGPEPADAGRLNAMAIHAGATTTGNVKMNWGRSEMTVWKKVIFPSLGVWLKKCYWLTKTVVAVEECKSRALPTNFEDGEMQEVDGEDAVFTFSIDEGDVEEASGGQKKRASEEDSKAAVEAGPSTATMAAPAASQPAPRTTSPPSAPNPSDSPRLGSPSPGGHGPASPLIAPSPLRPLSPALAPLPSPIHSPTARSFSPVSPTPPSPASSAYMDISASRLSPATLPASSPSISSSSLPSDHESAGPGIPVAKGKAPARSSTSMLGTRGTKRAPRTLPSAEQKNRVKAGLAAKPSVAAGASSSPGKRKRVFVEIEKQVKRKKAANVEAADSSKSGLPEMPDLPTDVHSYARNTLSIAWSEIALKIEGFRELVELWVRFEHQEGFAGEANLGTSGRPTWVAEWIRRARSPKYLRPRDPDEVIEPFWKWWESLQPGWREFRNSRPTDKLYRVPDGDVECLRIAGQNGLASVIACLGYGAYCVEGMTVKSEADRMMMDLQWEELSSAARDVSWVLRALVSRR
ncbi:SERTA domain-containing protein 3 [Marasmius crinis-equi]|uniref:SERTA domain-containing protein 3 n=1 Tax=Marasmius crinis-equi TaxID=585013 RepID=A0ABR3FCN0_9AGAR